MTPRTIQIASLFGRYVAAIIVSFVTSLAALFLSMAIALGLGEVGFYVVFALVGFSGVLSGTFCLRRGSRRVGSVLLLLLGLAYYSYFWVRMNYIRPEYHPKEFPHFLPLAIGGIIAVAFICLRRSLDAKTD